MEHVSLCTYGQEVAEVLNVRGVTAGVGGGRTRRVGCVDYRHGVSYECTAETLANDDTFT